MYMENLPYYLGTGYLFSELSLHYGHQKFGKKNLAESDRISFQTF
jgi:hypothetical protein